MSILLHTKIHDDDHSQAAVDKQAKDMLCEIKRFVFQYSSWLGNNIVAPHSKYHMTSQSSGQSRAHVNLSFVWRHLFYIMALKNGAVDSCDEGPAIQLYEDNQPWKVARTIPQRLLLYFQVIFWSCWWLSRLSSRIYEQHSEMTLVVSMFVCELASTRYCGTT